MADSEERQGNSREKNFVEHVIAKAGTDPGYAACLRRADNPATEYYGYEALASFGIDLQKESQRMPFALVGAAICREKPNADGNAGLGEAIARCFGENRDQGNLRLKRLMTCDSPREACLILRPLLMLMQSRNKASLSYARLLSDLLRFYGAGADRIKQRWAMEFYAIAPPDEKESDKLGGKNEGQS